MSKNNNDPSVLDKLSHMVKEHKAKVAKKNLEDIPRSSQRLALIVHVFFIALYFMLAQVTPYDNSISLFMCAYLTIALVGIAFHLKDKIKTPFVKSMGYILMSTIAGLLVGIALYHSPIGTNFEQKHLVVFFESNKALIGSDYYNTYSQNKGNIMELRELRKKINDDINI